MKGPERERERDVLVVGRLLGGIFLPVWNNKRFINSLHLWFYLAKQMWIISEYIICSLYPNVNYNHSQIIHVSGIPGKFKGS